MPDSLVMARWLEYLRFKTLHVVKKKKLEANSWKSQQLCAPWSSPHPNAEMYHRIISDSQQCDFTFKPWILRPLDKHPSTPNHLRNGTLLAIFFNVTNQGSLERPVASSQGCGLQCRWNFGCCQKWIARNLYLRNAVRQRWWFKHPGITSWDVSVSKLSVVWWMMDNWTWKYERNWVSSSFELLGFHLPVGKEKVYPRTCSELHSCLHPEFWVMQDFSTLKWVKVMTYHGQVNGRAPPKLYEMGHSISN